MGSGGASGVQLIPIGAVSQRTGLSTHVLRAWEKRYRAVEPKRMPRGIRGYDDADVIKLRLLKRATESGYAIGRVAGMSTAELLEILRDEPAPPINLRAGEGELHMAVCLEAVEAMDGPRIYASLMRSLVIMGSEHFVDELVVPLLHRVGELWETGTICPAHEHLLSAALHRVLPWMMAVSYTHLTLPTIYSV